MVYGVQRNQIIAALYLSYCAVLVFLVYPGTSWWGRAVCFVVSACWGVISYDIISCVVGSCCARSIDRLAEITNDRTTARWIVLNLVIGGFGVVVLCISASSGYCYGW